MSMDRDALVAAHSRALHGLQDATSARLTAGWDRLGSYTRPDSKRFVAAAVPVVLAAEKIAAAQVHAFVGAYLDHPVPAPPLDQVTGAAVRRGVDPTEVYQRPFRDMWYQVGQGTPYDAALKIGRDQLDVLARTDVQLASRSASSTIGEARGSGVAGWVRVAGPGACDLCAGADGEEIGPGDEIGCHPFCGCVASPLDSPPDPNADGEDPSAFDTHEHGEYGPYLMAAGDKFG